MNDKDRHLPPVVRDLYFKYVGILWSSSIDVTTHLHVCVVQFRARVLFWWEEGGGIHGSHDHFHSYEELHLSYFYHI